MRPIVIVLIVLALGTAGIAAFLVSQFLASQTPAPTATNAAQTGTQNVLVAARDIVPGTVLTPDDLRWEPWPETLIDQRFVVQPAQVENQAAGQDPQQEFLDRIARRSIMAGEPMSREMVIKQGDSGVTAANLAKGMRAITINVTPPQGVAGLILPNDHVDILMSLTVRDIVGIVGWKDVVLRYSAETIMKDLRVVAINQKLSHDPKEGVAEPGNLVTLEVTPEQAERLLVSQQTGTLSLALRSMVPGANDNDKTQSFTMDVRASRALSSLVALDLEEDEANLPQTTAEAVKMAKERAKRRTEVKINRGGSIAIQKFGQ
ncbi:Flp pilus assembly protein CpaB [Dongia sedimenti]|uniref:Flp pilus assembly protein CpaB n=1 Tax=Dongia sedimenti TaxID=3064282 RepID=A0ABU0YQ90_9PROT|nr:Flp pilus assembly protein CpaB [Rhodospirillaceae bacterium R-7]